MISKDDLWDVCLAQPFQPFYLRVNDGRKFYIRYPEIVKFGVSDVWLSTPLMNLQELGRWIKLKFEDLEAVELAVKSNGNGKSESISCDDLFDLCMAKPFQPFYLRLNDGRRFYIRDPEIVSFGAKDISLSAVLLRLQDQGHSIRFNPEDIAAVELKNNAASEK